MGKRHRRRVRELRSLRGDITGMSFRFRSLGEPPPVHFNCRCDIIAGDTSHLSRPRVHLIDVGANPRKHRYPYYVDVLGTRRWVSQAMRDVLDALVPDWEGTGGEIIETAQLLVAEDA